eukprot:69105_1
MAENQNKTESQLNPFHYDHYMTDDEFRTATALITELIIKYKNDLANSKYQIYDDTASTSRIQDLFPKQFPENKCSIKQLIDDITDKVIPNMTHWASPDFYAWIKCGHTMYHNIISNMLQAGLGTVPFTYMSNPISTELEIITLRWYAQLLNFPSKYYNHTNIINSVILSFASESICVSMIAAKERIMHQISGNIMHKLTLYGSDQTHFSFLKAVKIIGIPVENCRLIKTTEQDGFTLNTNGLRTTILNDINNGFYPFFVCFNIGTTAFSAIDNVIDLTYIVNEINNKYKKQCNIWKHVDGAFGLSYGCIHKLKWITNGLNDVDSIVVNGHKVLGLSLGNSLLYLNDPKYLLKALSLSKEHEIYLLQKMKESKKNINYKDWQLSLGRPWRSLQLYVGAKLLGKNGFINHIQRSLDLAIKFEKLLESDERIYIYKPRYLNNICIRIRNMNYQNHMDLLSRINKNYKIFITHSEHNNQCLLR